MSTPTFTDTHNLVAFLKKPAESAGFEQIIDFLKSKPIHYALTVNPTIYVSCVKQFWDMAKVKRVNDGEQIQALVDKKKVIITEDSIRSDLRFDDVFLFNEHYGICYYMFGCQKFNFSKYIFDNILKSLEGGIKFYLFPRFQQVFLDNQVEGMARHKEMYVISSLTKKIFANIRRIRAGFSRVVTPLFENMMVQAAAGMGDPLVKTHQTPIVDQPSTSRPQKKQKPRRKQRKEAKVSHDESEDEDHVPTPSSDPLSSGENRYTLNELMVFCTSLQEQVFDLQEAKDAQVKSPLENDSLGAQEDASKQGRMIEEIDQDDEIALDADTQERKNDDEMFGVDLSRDEVVTTVADKVSAAPTTDVTEDEITMA
nr:hypothetical protein [Tanacetum cinerariifolium]